MVRTYGSTRLAMNGRRDCRKGHALLVIFTVNVSILIIKKLLSSVFLIKKNQSQIEYVY